MEPRDVTNEMQKEEFWDAAAATNSDIFKFARVQVNDIYDHALCK